MKDNFDPIKEEKEGARAKRVVWSSKAIEKAIKGLSGGKKLVANPFYENNVRLLKGDLVYKRTPEEIEEWVRCSEDILYFAEKYCRLMTPEGIKNIKLRDYQKNYLQHVSENQLSIYLACRQCGKCLDFNEFIRIRGIFSEKLKEYFKKNYLFNAEENYYEIPLFELYNLYDKSTKWKLKYYLYKLIHKSPRKLHKLYSIISKLDQSNRSPQKIVNSYMVKNLQVFTPEGWVDIMFIHQTRPYERYIIKTENNNIECADDHILYSNNQPKFARDFRIGSLIDTINGPEEIIDIQVDYNRISMCDISVNNHSKTYYSNNFKSHNTTTSAVYLLYYLCFNTDKTALCTGNKRKTAIEILDKIKKIYLELPYFLKPGIYKWNESEIALDNGCRVLAEATTLNTGIGFTINLLLLDEFAHLQPNIIDKFYNNIFPTITAAKSKLLITSTQNGYNLFYKLYKAAELGENDYAPFKTDWWEVPEWSEEEKTWKVRDEAWHRRQVANYGSEEAFNLQFGTNFDVSSNSLISKHVMSDRFKNAMEYISKPILGVSDIECFKWRQDFDPMSDLRKNHITITCDLAEGSGHDSTVFMFNKLTEEGFENIGFFKSNKLTLDTCSKILLDITDKYCNMNTTLVSVEYNTYGELFIRICYNLLDKYSDIYKRFDTACFVRYEGSSASNYRLGIKMTSNNKPIFCNIFKLDYEKNLIKNNNIDFLRELEMFTDRGGGRFEAQLGHDDMVMAEIQLIPLKQTQQFKYLKESYDSTTYIFDQNILGESENSNLYNQFEFLNQYSEQNLNMDRLRKF